MILRNRFPEAISLQPTGPIEHSSPARCHRDSLLRARGHPRGSTRCGGRTLSTMASASLGNRHGGPSDLTPISIEPATVDPLHVRNRSFEDLFIGPLTQEGVTGSTHEYGLQIPSGGSPPGKNGRGPDRSEYLQGLLTGNEETEAIRLETAL